MELWKKYSDEFDDIAEARDEYATSIENIKAMGGMSPETKTKKLLEFDDKIRQLTADLRTIYYSFMRDLRANGHEVIFRKR